MDALLHDIIQLLIQVGPWIVLVVTATETAIFLGLLVPAEATVLVAAFMADIGYFEVEHVLAATLAGAFIGDQIGYILGRLYGRRAAVRQGRFGRMWRRHEARATILFRQRSILAVSVARFISFVRTLMPWFAGMSGMSYGRFLVYDIIGVTGWGVASVAAGYMAGRSWQALAGVLGTVSTIIVLGILAVGGTFAYRVRRRTRSLVRVGLTGNVASGKSVVATVWQDNGAVVIDADDLARQVVEPGTRGLREIVRRFGSDVLAADGTLDRAALRRRAFASETDRRALETILHPEIELLRQREELRLATAGTRLIVHAIPLLFEAGLAERFNTIVLVEAPEQERRRRLVELRKLPPADADAMIRAQQPSSEKHARSDYIIHNDAGLDELRERAEQVWAEIEAGAG